MRLQSLSARGPSTSNVLEQLDSQLDCPDRQNSMVFVFYGCTHDAGEIHAWLNCRFPKSAYIGGSSAGGLMTDKGFVDEHGIGLLLITDPDGDYGVANSLLGDSPAQTAENLLRQALNTCDSNGQLPELIWVYQAPGHEEEVLAGLRNVVGENCPIIGGSAADNDVDALWSQVGPDGVTRNGLSVGVLFPSTPLAYAFQGGYEPAGPNGVVTGVGAGLIGENVESTASDAELNTGREILSIDNEPAAAVYNRWLDNLLEQQLETGGSILGATTMLPLGTEAGKVEGVSQYHLIHAESISARGSLNAFRNVRRGDRLFAMKGESGRLVERAGRVGAQAVRTLERDGNSPAGALVVFCGGCKLAVNDQIDTVAGAMSKGFGEVPFTGCFTFGELGPLIDRNVHGNLMISAVVFSR